MKQKLTLLLIALLSTIGAGATEYTVTYSTSTGSYTATNPAGTWASKWVSTATDPQVTLSVGANNIATATGYIYSGASGCTYTLTAQTGYLITGYTITGTAQSGAQTLTPAAGGSATSFATTGTTTLTVSGLSTASTSFQQSTPNSGIAISSFTITLTEDPEFAQWEPSIADDAFLTVGEKVSSIETVTDVADNTKWYIVTQVRNGESPMYDAGVGTTLKRAAASVTPATLSETYAKNNITYLVRFFSAGDGLYNIQFANGSWIDGSLKTTASKGNAGTYAFYNSNGGSGSYFGWNLNSTSGSIVDNNGAGYTLAFWDSGTVSGTSGNNVWYVYETTVEVPASTVDVTYAQYVNGVATGVTHTETVLPNSDLNVPNNFYSGYSDLAYEFSTDGTIGESDVTINVNITLKSGIVLPSALSNSKKYTLVCKRGGLSTYTDNGTAYLASPIKTALGVSAKEFAIISYEDNNYLYSVSDEKFVTYSTNELAPLAAIVTGTSDAISFSQTTNSVYLIKFDNSDSKILNSSASYAYGVVINGWGASSSQWDDGCQYIINEVGDFDATAALAALEEHFHPAAETQFAEAIAALEAINFGTGLNQYSLTGEYAGYTSQAATIIAGLKNQGYTEENLAAAQTLLANYALNMPGAGFYRIKGNTSGKYLASGLASNSKFAMSDATDATTIFYFDGSKLVNFGSGMSNGMNSDAWKWVTEDKASTVVFQDGLTDGGYGIKSATCNFYDNGDNSNSADRGNDVTIQTSTNARYTSWYLEEVTTLPVAVTEAGYATLYAPVALTIPEGVTAYTGVINGEWFSMTKIDGEAIPAETAVVLEAAEGSYDFVTTTADAFEGDNVLQGTIGGTAAASNIYVLAQPAGEEVGFYNATAGNVSGFKAYLETSAGVKGFTFVFGDDATGINEVNGQWSMVNGQSIFNLAGQRIQKMQKGINIMNGKKILK